jgi:hypothetical protein
MDDCVDLSANSIQFDFIDKRTPEKAGQSSARKEDSEGNASVPDE